MNISNVKIHKSWLQQWKQCPYAFKLLTIDKVKPMETFETSLGTMFHEIAARYFDNPLKIEDVPEILKQPYKNFINWEQRRYKTLEVKGLQEFYKPIQIEVYLESKIHPIAGTIDRIDWFDPGKSIIVIDYKTGSWYNISTLRQELTLYALLAEENLRMPCDFIGMYNPVQDYFWMEQRKSQTEKALLKNINQMLEDLKNDKFEPKPSSHCGWCYALEYCEHAYEYGNEEAPE